ncbi:uncharacterized protein A4U43_C03F21320 [Asparagus officinalis]|uniref:Uncharacterized protein n=1 Tax=Asparagus officinalis TaxID=4686 RepID=A0A5P1FGU8_ASPOF|nr:uncharacterized protein A4U43_C03F21320 [Asparagus officinalis]
MLEGSEGGWSGKRNRGDSRRGVLVDNEGAAKGGSAAAWNGGAQSTRGEALDLGGRVDSAGDINGGWRWRRRKRRQGLGRGRRGHRGEKMNERGKRGVVGRRAMRCKQEKREYKNM